MTEAQKANDAVAPLSRPETVTVACKLPWGLLLDFHEPMEAGEIKARTVMHEYRIKLNGSKTVSNDKNQTLVTSGGYGITTNVNAELFEKWMHDHRDHPAVVKRLIWALFTEEEVKQEVKVMASVRNGFEPVRADFANVMTVDDMQKEAGALDQGIFS